METSKRLTVLRDLLAWSVIVGALLWVDSLREDESVISNDLKPHTQLEAVASCERSNFAGCVG